MHARVRAFAYGVSFSAVAAAGCQTPDLQPRRPISPIKAISPAAGSPTATPFQHVTPAAAVLPGGDSAGIVPAAGVAAPGGPLTVADLEQLALTYNPTLVQAATYIDAARGKALQAGLPYNPTVGMEAEQIGASRTAGEKIGRAHV